MRENTIRISLVALGVAAMLPVGASAAMAEPVDPGWPDEPVIEQPTPDPDPTPTVDPPGPDIVVTPVYPVKPPAGGDGPEEPEGSPCPSPDCPEDPATPGTPPDDPGAGDRHTDQPTREPSREPSDPPGDTSGQLPLTGTGTLVGLAGIGILLLGLGGLALLALRLLRRPGA